VAHQGPGRQRPGRDDRQRPGGGVAERVELRDGDARQLPFDDRSFDVVVSSMALHNIPGAGGRAAAVGEIVRVLKPGGHLAILDFRHTGQYAAVLAAAGLGEVHRSALACIHRCGS
jgi:arsenite methyltransferase